MRGNLRLHPSQGLLSTKQGEKLKAATTATFNAWHERENMEHLLNVKTCCRPRTSFVMWPLLLMLLFGLMWKKKFFSLFSICSFLSFMRKCGFVIHHLTLANYECPIVNYITQCLTLTQASVFWRSINPIAEWRAMWGEKKKGKTWKDLVNYYETRIFFLPNPHKGNLCLNCWLAVELNVEFVFLVFIGIDPLCIISLINLVESIQYKWIWLYETYRQKVKKKGQPLLQTLLTCSVSPA